MGPYNRYKQNYNPYKWPYKWVTGVVSPIRGATTLLIAGRGPSCMPCFVFYLPTQPNLLYFYIEKTITMFHQEFQVPKMEVLNLIRLFCGWVFPYISRIHTAYIIYIGVSYLHFGYLKCLVNCSTPNIYQANLHRGPP